jgi:segregation and condensation protein A
MIQIQLQKFEGPLALLLYLIRKEEMDIFDIPVYEITKQYLEYIKLMQELDLELAGDFVAMASTLIHIKSRMLLPQYDENGEVIEQDDPRKELVQRLLEYQKYQEAGQKLYERPLLNRDQWARGVREKLDSKDDEILLEENALFSLISAYRGAVRSIRNRIHQVTAKTQSIASRIVEMKDKLVVGVRLAMSDLLTEAAETKKQVLITFLSILELGKMGFISIYQAEGFSEIYIEALRPIEGDAISRVEEYDSMRADEVAQAMMEKASELDNFDELVSEELLPEEQIASDDEIFAAEMILQETEVDEQQG